MDPLGVDGIKAYGIEKLIQLATSQLNDQHPEESREAAPALLFDLQNVYDKTLDMMPTDVSENPPNNFLGAFLSIEALTFKCSSCSSCDKCRLVVSCFGSCSLCKYQVLVSMFPFILHLPVNTIRGVRCLDGS